MKIIIDEEICAELELLHYEVNSRKEIILSVLQTGIETNSLFKAYQEEYKQYFIEYNKTKQKMLNSYNISAGKSWNLDFATCELIIND